MRTKYSVYLNVFVASVLEVNMGLADLEQL